MRLGDVATFVRGITFKPGDVVPLGTADSVACMRTKNVQTRLDLSDVWAVPKRLAPRQEQLLRAGDLLVSTANSWNLVGKCSWVPELPWTSSFGGFVSALRSTSPALSARYLYHWFSSPRTQAIVRSFGRQTTNISNLNIALCLALELPLPLLAEQRRIAEVLDRAETLRAQRRQALAQLDALAEAVFRDVHAAAPKGGWPRVKVGDVAMSMRTGPFGSQLLHSEFVDDGIAVLGIDNVVRNEFTWAQPRFITPAKFAQLSRYRVFPGDVLITIMGTCGRCAIVPTDVPVAINTKHLCCMTLDVSRCLPEYLQSAFLLDPSVLYQLGVHERGAVMPGLNMQLIRDVDIPLPPLEVQKQFKKQLLSVAAQRQAFRTSAAQLDALFASLQHRAFRGEL